MNLNRSAARFFALSLLMGAASAGLAGCGSIDDALFGTEPGQPVAAGAQPEAQAGAQPEAQAGDQAEAQPSEQSEGETQTAAAAPASAPVASSGMPAISIESGSDTGTTVGHTVQNL